MASVLFVISQVNKKIQFRKRKIKFFLNRCYTFQLLSMCLLWHLVKVITVQRIKYAKFNSYHLNILVTGINVHLVTPITCAVCIFYTTLVFIFS
jgi:hypothetical protein